MIRLTRIPVSVGLLLEGLRASFRYRHFLVFSWLLILQATCPGEATLKALSRRGPVTSPISICVDCCVPGIGGPNFC